MSQQNSPEPEYPPAVPNGYPPPLPPPPKKSRGGGAIIVVSVVAVVVIAVCAVAGIAMVAGGDSDQASTNDSGGDDAGGENDKAAKEKEKVAKMGDQVTDGALTFTVEKVEDGVSEVGEDYLVEKADGQFIIVDVTAENTGDEAALFDDTEQKLVDAEGKEYSTDIEASIYAEDEEAFFDDINPGNKVSGQLIFDVPKDIDLDQILLSGDFTSDGVAVSLK